MADVQFRASQAAIAGQDAAGIDVVTGGEMHRRTNNRHAPPNAMLNFFWEKILGFSGETRPQPITPKDENVTHPGAVLTGKVGYGDLGPCYHRSQHRAVRLKVFVLLTENSRKAV